MIKKQINGMKNAKLEKLKRIMTLYAFFLIAGAGIMSARGSYSQATPEPEQAKTRVTGTVVDQSGEPVIGANVMEKGVAANGTITDTEGKFALEVKASATLQISFIGYITQEIGVSGQSSLNITLAEDNLSLEEVVVVGYGTQKKVTLTGSVVTAKGADIIKSPAVNVTNSLAGRLPGVIINNRSGEPGRENTSLYIRGRSTTGNTSALVVIDGVERGGLENINPNDIENISVLKDAAAAIYGARAANGVILVTTKRGSSPKPVIDFSYNQGFAQPTRMPKMADSHTFFSVYNEIEESEGRPARYSDAELQKFKEGVYPDYASIDWYDYVTKEWTPQHRTNVSVSGSGERAKYYISLGELSQDDMYENGARKYNQYNIRSNVDVKLSEHLTVGANLAGRYDDRHYPYEGANNLNSHIFLYQPNWLPYWPGTDYLEPNRDSESLLNWVSDKAGYIDQNVKTLQSSIFFNWQVPWVKGLSIDGTGSYDVASNFTKTFRIPTYVYYQNEAGGYTKGRSGSGVNKSTLTDRGEFSDQLYFTVKATWERAFGLHNTSAMIGYEQQKVSGNYLQAYRSDYTSTVIPQIFAGSTDKSMQSNDGSASQGARQNVYGRLNYDYAGKYMAQFTMRRDGSPNFPKEKRFGYFPSASAGWRLSEESFMKELDYINNLKVRGSYGVMGNDLVSSFQYLTTYGYGRNYVIGGTDVSGLQETSVPNPNITWETAKTWNIGLDATLWDGLLGVEFDYFKTRRSDILTKRSATIPSYTGLTLPDENIGIVDNRGFELVLTHANSINDFRYNISANVSFARNKVVYIDEQPAAEPYQFATGRPMGSSLLYNSLGIFRDQAAIDAYPHLPGTVPGDIIYEDVNGDGEINSRDRVRQDLINIPEIVYGLNASFAWKGFDLSLLFQGQENARQSFGGISGNWFPVMSYSFGNFLAWRAEDRWSPSNTDGTMPRASAALWNNSTNSVYNSTHWTKNAGFLRLKNVELGYQLPGQVCNRIGIQGLRFSVSAYNLFIIYDHMKDQGFDPETTEFWYYQQQRTLNLGVNLTY
ncbi:MAG: TonB-dependent receptor [Tannerella sp.]|nr:TonB-dependent receptor [Tannerella sp.]